MNPNTSFSKKSNIARWIMRFSPILLLAACLVGLANPMTKPEMLWLLEENHPIEFLTFLFFIAGGACGMYLVFLIRHDNLYSFYLKLFYLFFSLMLLFIAMEEVAWGQKIFGFETPGLFKQVNQQGELTLHNIGCLQGHSEWFRLIFGVSGLLDIIGSKIRAVKAICVPSCLLPWLLTITVHASIDVLDDVIPVSRYFHEIIQRSSELIEMLIATVGFLCIWLELRKYISSQHQPSN